MQLQDEGILLRVFIGELDKVDHKPMYEAIVHKAKEAGLAGATVWKGIEAFGAASRIHTAKILRLSEDLPLVIEIVDTEEKINGFVPELNKMFEEAGCGGLVTMEKVKVIKYTPGDNARHK